MKGLWAFMKTRPVFSLAVGIILSVGVYVLVDAVIVTDRERIDAAIERGKKAILAGDAAAVMAIADADFATDQHTHEQFERFLEHYLSSHNIESIGIIRREIEVQGPVAEVYISGAARLTWRDQDVQTRGSFEYHLAFRKRGREWKLKSAQGTEL